MAINRNSQISEEIRDAFKLQQNVDGTISNVASQIIPVCEVNPKMMRRINVVVTSAKATTGPNTTYTTPSDKDFFLIGYIYNLIKDAACDAASGQISNITAVQDGQTKTIGTIAGITLTAQNERMIVMLNYPMKLDRATTINNTGTYAAGVMQRTLTIFGYEVYNPKA